MDEDKISSSVNEIVEVNAGRAAYYRMLAELLWKELTQEQIDHLAALDLKSLAQGDADLEEGYGDMASYLRRRNTGTRQELAVDYAHTFLAAGNYESFAATPFESVFTSEMGLLMQDARDEVYKSFCGEHIQPDEELHTPEDHLSFEFEFLATLLERTNAACLAGDFERAAMLSQKVAEFHDDHQLNWVDDFCDAVCDVAETRFYRGMSKVVRAFVHMETDVIADMVEASDALAASAAA